MKSPGIAIAAACALVLAVARGGDRPRAQAKEAVGTIEAAAKAAAGQDWPSLYRRLCSPVDSSDALRGVERARATRDAPAEWHQEPAKVFDNLYFLGTRDVAAWAVTTSQGIILIDSLYEYAVEDEIVGGLKTLGLNPADIKIVIVTHGHVDHSGGARRLQAHYGARVMLSAPDWDLLETDQSPASKPMRDLVVAKDQKLTLGETTLALYLTPGHTPGTISLLIPVKEAGQSHLVAMWGGTGLSRRAGARNLEQYVASARRFADVVRKSKADGVISGHDVFGEHLKKIAAMKEAPKNAPAANPFIVGPDAAERYLEVVRDCGTAALAAAR